MTKVKVLGPAGSGKGHLINALIAQMKALGFIPAIITAGEELVAKSHGISAEAKLIAKRLAKREMVPDNITLRAIHAAYGAKVHRGVTQVIFDGCPRNEFQADYVMNHFRGTRHVVISVEASLRRCQENALKKRKRVDDHPELLEAAYQRYLDFEVGGIDRLVELGAEIIRVRCPEYSDEPEWDIADQATAVLQQMRLGRVLKFSDRPNPQQRELTSV